MENRFKKARTVYNRHGTQSTQEVAKETGVTKSLIEDIESTVGKQRYVGYLTVKKLAQHYGVSADYLLELTDTPSIDPQIQIAHKVTGLPENAIYQLSRLATVANGNRAINTLLGSPKLYNFASYLATFFYGEWVEEFTGEEEGHISSLRKINVDDEIFSRYIQPAMLVQINQVLTEIKNYLKEGGRNNGQRQTE